MAGKPERKQAAVFFTFVMFVVVAFAVLAVTNLLKPLFILLVVLLAIIVLYAQAGKFFVQVEEYERAVIFKYGRFKEVAGPGWVVIIPFVESYQLVDLRVQKDDVLKQEVVTKDNIRLTIDAIFYIKAVDPKAAILNVEDYKGTVTSLIQAALRDIVGKMTLDQVISNIDQINKLMLSKLSETCLSWGVEMTKVELQSVTLPPAVIEAMHKRRAASEEKVAMAERAAGKRMEIEAILEATKKLPSSTLQYYYLQSLQKMAEGKSTKFIFPLELSNLASAISAKLGVPYSEAQEKVVEKYQELRKEEPKAAPKTIVEELRDEFDVPAEKPHKSAAKPTKKQREEFDFE